MTDSTPIADQVIDHLLEALDETQILGAFRPLLTRYGGINASLLYYEGTPTPEYVVARSVALLTADGEVTPTGILLNSDDYPDFAHAIRNHHPIRYIHDTLDLPDAGDTKQLREILLASGIRAVLSWTLRTGDQWDGIVSINYADSQEFSPELQAAAERIYPTLRAMVNRRRAALAERNLRETLEQRVAERSAELAANQRVLRTILDSVPIRLFWKDVNSVYLGSNARFAADAGMSPEEIIGKSDADLPWSHAAERYMEDDRRVMDNRASLGAYEEPLYTAAGPMGTALVDKVPLFDDNGAVFGVLGIVADITRQRELEAEREQMQLQVIESQRQTLVELSTPIIPVFEGILVLPLIGGIDTLRAREITRALLNGISEHKAQVVIVDITGVPVVDSGVASYLNKAVQAARLKGAHTIITGMSAAIAETIVDLGIDWAQIETLSDLQSGLRRAMAQMGYQMAARAH